jgi:ribonuclease P protein component
MKADEGLPPQRRVRKRQDFLRIQSSKRKLRSPHLLLALSAPRNKDTTDSRIGITVTRKVDKRAARRNRLKRRVREFFRRERILFTEPVDMVVIALDGATELDYQQVCWELRGLLLKMGLLKRGATRPASS